MAAEEQIENWADEAKVGYGVAELKQRRRGRPGRGAGPMQVVALWIEPRDGDGPPERELRLGFDTAARLLETVVLVFSSGDEIVIHAMPARKQWCDLLP